MFDIRLCFERLNLGRSSDIGLGEGFLNIIYMLLRLF